MIPNLPYLEGNQRDWNSLSLEQQRERVALNAERQHAANVAAYRAGRLARLQDYEGPLTQAGNPTLAGAKAHTGLDDITSAQVREIWAQREETDDA